MEGIGRELRHTAYSVRRVDADRNVLDGFLGNAEAQPLCTVCKANDARYCCPRCNEVYCSSKCFAQHGASCTERFFQTRVEQELRGREEGGEQTMLRGRARCVGDLLKQEEGDGVEGLSLSSLRLEELQAGAEPTLDEEAAMLAAVERGEVDVAEPWREWWRGISAVDDDVLEAEGVLREVDDDVSKLVAREASAASQPPAQTSERADLLQAAAQLGPPWTLAWQDDEDRAALAREGPAWVVRRIRAERLAPAAATLAFSVVDVLYSYAHACRIFDGEIQYAFREAAAAIVAGSAVLSADGRPASAAAALGDCAERARRLAPDASKGFASAYRVSFARDVAALLTTPAVAAAALLDAWRCVRRTKRGKSARKLRYLALWVAHDGRNLLREAREGVLQEADRLCALDPSKQTPAANGLRVVAPDVLRPSIQAATLSGKIVEPTAFNPATSFDEPD